MFEYSCRCCLTNDRLLVSLTTESNHRDNKNLWEYLYVVLGSTAKEFIKPSFICLRCSKALQVAYHFIDMAMQSEQKLRNYNYDISEDKPKGNPKIKKNEKQEFNNSYVFISETQTQLEKTNQSINNLENQFKIHINNMSQMPGAIKNDSKLQKQHIQNPYKVASKIPRKGKVLSALNCSICQTQFENKDQLDQHNQQMHKEIVPFKCKICNFYTCYSASILKHYSKDHNLSNVELELYQTNEIYNNVSEYINFELNFICLECDFKSNSQSNIDEHLYAEHMIEEDKDLFIVKCYNCPACYRSFNELKSAKTHYTMLHKSLKKMETIASENHACDKCGKIFHSKRSLLLHKRFCELRVPVKCNFCELQFSSVLKYEQHLEANHAVAIKHECEICGKIFNSSELLAIHRKRHNQRYFQCDLCPKNYINNAELKLHKQRVHNINVRTLCSLCNKTFRNIFQLRNHENKEHIKNYHKCAYCEFRSHSKFIIKVHQYKHTGKPYQCKLCPKEFVLRKDIKHHYLKHHSLVISNEELAEMFKQSKGYLSRFDAFSKENNNLEITEINELELEGELKEFGLTLKDIMEDLFDNCEFNEIN